ncbi:ankyrin repeat domain-containing protein [Aspergillus homomorphus CBS 101889]|uniref:Uncharacterized protein n=1 Tax=Aspergillus homomorphus (strain CBS 101889) TaxID=1450537 RepID=A0A395HZR5_ASPHC|nr:hypothetical protein BO97DRAFT_425064 [Aspergillus homomorphus CBS 101889]RAL11764.1 hypothetical protein BO97DRAFT_425064 [Aspergillus homomorphus CBS 101889]
MSQVPAGQRIPLELLLLCAESMDNQTLVRFTTTCKRFRVGLEYVVRQRANAYAIPRKSATWFSEVVANVLSDPSRKSHSDRELVEIDFASDLQAALYSGKEEFYGVRLPRQRFRDAIINGQYTIVERFLNAGVDPNGLDFREIPMLHLAIMTGNPAMVSLLLQHGADPNIENILKSKALDFRFHQRVEAEISRILIHAGAVPTNLTEFSDRMLSVDDGAHLLLGAVENAVGTAEPWWWWNVLSDAIVWNCEQFLHDILNAKPDLLRFSSMQSVDPQHYSLFELALKFRHWNIAILLVRKGCPLQKEPAEYAFCNSNKPHVLYKELRQALLSPCQGLLEALLDRPEVREYELQEDVILGQWFRPSIWACMNDSAFDEALGI